MGCFYGIFRAVIGWMWRAVVLWRYGSLDVRLLILGQVNQFMAVVARYGR